MVALTVSLLVPWSIHLDKHLSISPGNCLQSVYPDICDALKLIKHTPSLSSSGARRFCYPGLLQQSTPPVIQLFLRRTPEGLIGSSFYASLPLPNDLIAPISKLQPTHTQFWSLLVSKSLTYLVLIVKSFPTFSFAVYRMTLRLVIWNEGQEMITA